MFNVHATILFSAPEHNWMDHYTKAFYNNNNTMKNMHLVYELKVCSPNCFTKICVLVKYIEMTDGGSKCQVNTTILCLTKYPDVLKKCLQILCIHGSHTFSNTKFN